jgi:hypothetical protein
LGGVVVPVGREARSSGRASESLGGVLDD